MLEEEEILWKQLMHDGNAKVHTLHKTKKGEGLFAKLINLYLLQYSKKFLEIFLLKVFQ